MKQGERSADALGAKLTKALSPRALSANSFGRGPAELARSFERAADSADEAFEAVRKLDREGLDTAKARKYAQVLEEIGIEAQQTRADLASLQKADPRFNTPELKAAADQLDRVAREAADSARELGRIKGVGASTEFERLAHEAREAGTNLGTASRQTDGLMGKLKGVKGILLGLGLAVGTQQILSFASDAAEVFIDLERAGKSVDQIFGNASSTIDDWAERSADAAGLSKREVKDSAAVQGQALINMGYDAQSAADEVVKLQQRGADLAATFGGTAADAIHAVGSLLRGERDPIEKFGVSIKQVDVNARIASLGLDTSTDAARRNAEAIASLDLFYEQTAGNAGRFARSQDDVGVQLDKNQAKIEDGMGAVGQEVASIQLGAIKTADAIGGYLDTSSRNIAAFTMNFGSQRVRILQLADEAGVSFEEMKQRILAAMDFSGVDADTIIFQMEGGEEAVAYTKEQALAAVRAVSDSYALGGPVVAEEAGKIAGMLPSEIQAHVDDVKAAAEDMMGPNGLAGGILAAQQKPLDAIDELNRVMDESLSEAEQIALLTGEDAVKALTTGLNSPLLVDRLAANDAYAKIIEQLNALGPAGYAAGLAFARALGIGIDDGAADPVHGPAAAARRVASGIRDPFPQSEPKDPLSPLRGWTKYNPLQIVYDNIAASAPEAAAATRAALAGMVMPAIGSPAMVAGSQTLLPVTAASGGGNTIHVEMIDRVEKRTVEDIGGGLKRLEFLGKLPR